MDVLTGAVASEVAPHAGAWIETKEVFMAFVGDAVAPHAGAWIETCNATTASQMSHVAPHAGAWIETFKNAGYGSQRRSRAPRGRVD